MRSDKVEVNEDSTLRAPGKTGDGSPVDEIALPSPQGPGLPRAVGDISAAAVELRSPLALTRRCYEGCRHDH